MPEINLLPAEKKPKPSVLKLSRTLKKILTIVSVVFVVTAGVFLAAFFLFSNRIKVAKSRDLELEKQIKALKQTEQRYFLLKDRLAKVEKVKVKENALDEVKILSDVLAMVKERVVFSDADLNTKTATITVYSLNSTDLSGFIKDLVQEGNFRSIKLESLELTPPKGYQTVFLLER